MHQDVYIYRDLIKNYTVHVSGKAVYMHVSKQ